MVEENNVENQQQTQQQTQQPEQQPEQQTTQAANTQAVNAQTANTQAANTQTAQGAQGTQQVPNASSKEEQVGFHKGALSTLAKEREELSRLVNIVEQLMQMHVKGLKDLGVDLQEQVQQTPGSQGPQDNNKPIEDLVN